MRKYDLGGIISLATQVLPIIKQGVQGVAQDFKSNRLQRKLGSRAGMMNYSNFAGAIPAFGMGGMIEVEGGETMMRGGDRVRFKGPKHKHGGIAYMGQEGAYIMPSYDGTAAEHKKVMDKYGKRNDEAGRNMMKHYERRLMMKTEKKHGRLGSRMGNKFALGGAVSSLLGPSAPSLFGDMMNDPNRLPVTPLNSIAPYSASNPFAADPTDLAGESRYGFTDNIYSAKFSAPHKSYNLRQIPIEDRVDMDMESLSARLAENPLVDIPENNFMTDPAKLADFRSDLKVDEVARERAGENKRGFGKFLRGVVFGKNKEKMSRKEQGLTGMKNPLMMGKGLEMGILAAQALLPTKVAPVRTNPEYGKISSLMAQRRYDPQSLMNSVYRNTNAGIQSINNSTSNQAVRRSNMAQMFANSNQAIAGANLQGQQMNNQYMAQQAASLMGLGSERLKSMERRDHYQMMADGAKQRAMSDLGTSFGNLGTYLHNSNTDALTANEMFKILSETNPNFNPGGLSLPEYKKRLGLKNKRIVEFDKKTKKPSSNANRTLQ